uniref:Uncharacterized protein n=1 Tax=Cannabis sativa TaxID=3483 RepID=A0A803NFA5_CANSA
MRAAHQSPAREKLTSHAPAGCRLAGHTMFNLTGYVPASFVKSWPIPFMCCPTLVMANLYRWRLTLRGGGQPLSAFGGGAYARTLANHTSSSWPTYGRNLVGQTWWYNSLMARLTSFACCLAIFPYLVRRLYLAIAKVVLYMYSVLA